LAKELDAVARKEDPGRITVISANRNEIYNSSGLADIPQVFGWHMYFGWYYGALAELGPFLDEQHRRYPARPIL
jgi:beta-galactosidase